MLLIYMVIRCLKYPDLYTDKLEEFLNTPDDNDNGFFIEVHLNYPDKKEETTKHFSCCPENRKFNPDKYNDYMKKIKPINYTTSKKLKCDWVDKKNYLIHYRILIFFVGHGMVTDKVQEIISFKQSKWLEKYFSPITQKRNRAKNDFEKDVFKLLVNAAFRKMIENDRNRLKIDFIKKCDYKKVLFNNQS